MSKPGNAGVLRVGGRENGMGDRVNGLLNVQTWKTLRAEGLGEREGDGCSGERALKCPNLEILEG